MGTIAALPCAKITKGQERLTPDQIEYARQFAQKRIASMLATTAVDEREAERHLSEAYRVAGLEPPKRFRWFDSPIAFCMAHFGDSVRDSVRDSVWDSVWDSVRVSVRDSVWDSVRAYLDENWLAFYRFFCEVFEYNKLIHLALFNEMVGGYQLGKEEAWLVRKPIRLERDEQERPHSADGMCMQYRDGWGFYAWHGTRTSEHIIMQSDLLAKEDWLNEQNMEIRRVIQERLGNDRFVELVGGQCIDTGKRGRLIAVDLGSDPERVAHYVHVQDSSTPRQYYLRVPPTIRTADRAVAWTFGLTEETYQPMQET